MSWGHLGRWNEVVYLRSGSPVLPVCLPILANMAVLFFWPSCSGCSVRCTVLVVLFWQSYTGSLVLAIVPCISCLGCLALLFLFCVSQSACPILPLPFYLSHSACPFLVVPFWLSCLYWLSFPGCPFLAILHWLSCPGCPVLAHVLAESNQIRIPRRIRNHMRKDFMMWTRGQEEMSDEKISWDCSFKWVHRRFHICVARLIKSKTCYDIWFATLVKSESRYKNLLTSLATISRKCGSESESRISRKC